MFETPFSELPGEPVPLQSLRTINCHAVKMNLILGSSQQAFRAKLAKLTE